MNKDYKQIKYRYWNGVILRKTIYKGICMCEEGILVTWLGSDLRFKQQSNIP